jgi:hypothetical protein
MEKRWEDMTARERQEARFAKLMAGEGLEFKNPENKAKYERRLTRLKDAIQLEKEPDRVPILPWATFMQTTMTGATPAESLYDADKMLAAMKKYVLDFDPDYYGSMVIIPPGKTLELLGYSLYKWPGFNLPDKYVYQCLESDYMKADDYPAFINDPTDFWLRKYLPTHFKILEPLTQMPPLTGLFEIPCIPPYMMALGSPPGQEMLQKLMEASKFAFDWAMKVLALDKELQENGNIPFAGGIAKAPFDVLADTLRGSHGIFMDLYRQPDMIVEACERLVPLAIDLALGGVAGSGNPIVFMPLHKGADGWLSDEQFQKFYWPSLKAVMEGLIEEGCVPFLFAEGGYNDRLEYLNELPKGHTIWLFDRTDMAVAKQKAGANVCIAGNVPISQIMTNTPEKVKATCKTLIDTCAPGGGYLMGLGCAADEGKPETIKAMFEFTKTYGVYKQT